MDSYTAMKKMPSKSGWDMECMISQDMVSCQESCPVTHGHRHNLKNRFELKKTLGEGTYGKVKLAVSRTTGEQVAIKYIKKSKIKDEHDLARIRREIKIMSSLRHPQVVNVYEVFENKDKIILVMECADGGELYDYINNNRLTEKDARRIFRQIVSAIAYCHQNGIVHRDLKLENILLDHNNNAKIADFGLSNFFNNDDMLKTYCGSPLYASPEIVSGQPYYGPEVDCWSLGVVLYTLVYGTMPFDGTDFKKLRNQITTGDYYEPEKPSEAAGLIRHLLTVNPKKRATITDIVSHWWVNLGHRTQPDSLPYHPPMVLQPVSACKNQGHSSSESDDGEPECRNKPKTVKPLKGILKKPKITNNDTNAKMCNETNTQREIQQEINENSNPLHKHTGTETVFRSSDEDQTSQTASLLTDTEEKTQSTDLAADGADAVFITSSNSTKVFDSSRKPKRGILKQKGKFSSGDSGCEMGDTSKKQNSAANLSIVPMDLSEGDSALDSPDNVTVDPKCNQNNQCDTNMPGAFNFEPTASSQVGSLSLQVGAGVVGTVVRRRRGILKNSYLDADKRLSACSTGSNSSADILDFSYDSAEDSPSTKFYQEAEGPPKNLDDYVTEIREVHVQGMAALSRDQCFDSDAKDVLQKAWDICKSLS